MTDYSKLDALILASLSDKPRNFCGLLGGEILSATIEMEAATAMPGPRGKMVAVTPGFRFLDRRLQALSKKGQIRFNKNSKLWELAK